MGPAANVTNSSRRDVADGTQFYWTSLSTPVTVQFIEDSFRCLLLLENEDAGHLIYVFSVARERFLGNGLRIVEHQF